MVVYLGGEYSYNIFLPGNICSSQRKEQEENRSVWEAYVKGLTL